MSGEKNLSRLLSSMSPMLMAGEFVFCCIDNARYGDHSQLEPLAVVAENEGLTLVIPRFRADQYHLKYESVFRGITLRIHSSLDAVGLTAAFSSKLAEHGISVNVIAGFYHDHIFVQKEMADKALAALNQLAAEEVSG